MIVALLTLLLTTLALDFAGAIDGSRDRGDAAGWADPGSGPAGGAWAGGLLALRASAWTTEDVATEPATPGRGFWGRIAAFVRRRPVVWVVGSAALLGVLALGNIGTPEVFNFLTGFRSPTPSAAGYAC